jgi:hypothetical protein
MNLFCTSLPMAAKARLVVMTKAWAAHSHSWTGF